MVELLSTKIFIPRTRVNLVSRPHLIDRLNAGLKKKLTLIAAPAGFGKTTLLSEWIPHSPRCVTWLSLDETDNDPTKFWAYFISALQQLRPDLGAGALSLLESNQAPPITSILTVLINDITEFPDVFSIVLEDYHVIDFQPIHESLTFMIDHMPVNMHLVITTRVDPALPLARLRARDNLTELRANDLRFNANEVGQFLTQVMELDLSDEDISALEVRTEGWIAGLQIAALSLQGREDVQGFIRAFSGGHRHILGYLAEEALNQRPEGTLNFLLQTSILDRLCGPLCDAVTAGSGSQAILESLEHANLFIMPLDDEGVWYRYHHLFAEVLHARLLRTQRDVVPELYRRAGSWHASQGMLDEAVHYMLSGADFEQASRLIEEVAGVMIRRGSSITVIKWLDAMPEEMIRARPLLCLARGWTYFMGAALSLDKAEEWARLALQAAMVSGSLDSGIAGEAAALQAMIAATRSEVLRSLELSRQALDYLPLDSPWRSAMAFCLGTGHYLTGEITAAVPIFEEALELSLADGAYYIQFASASFIAEILVFQGRLNRALELYEQVLAWSDPNLPQKGGIMAYGGRAGISYERNMLDAALADIQSGFEQVEQVGGAWSAYLLYRVQARIEQAHDNWENALDALNRAYRLGQTAKVGLVEAQAAALRASLQLARGDLESALTWAANSGLSYDDPEANHPGWRELEYLSLARVLNAQAKYIEALSLLERLLAAAEAELRLGSVINILVSESMVYLAQEGKTHALNCLERALMLAEPEGYMRVFLDEGDPMRVLLAEYQSLLRRKISNADGNSSLRILTYTEMLLAAFTQPHNAAMTHTELMIEKVSEREMEVLRLIEDGMTNQEIAEQMVIAVSTVKSHINSLYGKVGAHNRTQAVAIAREHGLLTN